MLGRRHSGPCRGGRRRLWHRLECLRRTCRRLELVLYSCVHLPSHKGVYEEAVGRLGDRCWVVDIIAVVSPTDCRQDDVVKWSRTGSVSPHLSECLYRVREVNGVNKTLTLLVHGPWVVRAWVCHASMDLLVVTLECLSRVSLWADMLHGSMCVDPMYVDPDNSLSAYVHGSFTTLPARALL